MKRQAEDTGLVASSSKKRVTDWPEEDLSPETASVLSAGDTESTSAIRPTQTDAATSITTSTRVARKYPSDLKTISCTVPGCNKTFNRPARLAAHLRSHTNDRPFRCPYTECDKDYREEKHLAQHIKGSHTHEKKYTCEVSGCGKSFVTSTRLRRHALVHEGAERFRCRGYEGCEKSFRKHQTLQRHIRTDHLGAKAFQCGNDGCEAGFDTAGSLRRHVEKEHGELKYWCDMCSNEETGGVGFTTLSLLEAHTKKNHIDCYFCETTCTSQADFEQHMELHHSETLAKEQKSVQERKNVTCTFEGCDKSFTLRKNLNHHIRVHHQNQRWVCGEFDTYEVKGLEDWNWMEEGCKKEFFSKVKLEEHVLYVHLGKQRPPTMYTISSRDHADLDVMTGVAAKSTTPCPEQGCQARFVRQLELEKHIREQHPQVIAEGVAAIDPALGGFDDLPADFVLRPQLQQDNNLRSYPGEAQPLFETRWDDDEWSEMRKLIDVDGLVNG